MVYRSSSTVRECTLSRYTGNVNSKFNTPGLNTDQILGAKKIKIKFKKWKNSGSKKKWKKEKKNNIKFNTRVINTDQILGANKKIEKKNKK